MVFYTSVFSFVKDALEDKLPESLDDVSLFCEYSRFHILNMPFESLIELFIIGLEEISIDRIENYILSKGLIKDIKKLERTGGVLYGVNQKFSFNIFSKHKVYQSIDWEDFEEFMTFRYGVFYNFDHRAPLSISISFQLREHPCRFFEVK
ncbi:MAG: hypothetical protein ACRCXZ_04290 [Patescibacteria group bacterium]